MAIPIDQYLHQEVKDYIRDKYDSKKKVTSYFRKGSWQTSRYIQVSTAHPINQGENSLIL